MNLKTIYRKRPDIKEKVEADFPKPKKECDIEKEKRQGKMWERAKRYYKQPEGKVEYLPGVDLSQVIESNPQYTTEI